MHDGGHAGRPQPGFALRGLFVLAALVFTKYAQPLLAPVLFALVLAVVLAPWVQGLRRRGVPEWVGAGVVVLALVASVLPLAIALAEPAADWWQRASQVLAELVARLQRLRAAIPGLGAGGAQADGPIAERLASEGMALTALLLERGLAFTLSAAATVILLYFLLASEHWLLPRAVQALPRPRQRARVLACALAAQRDIGRFLSALAVINLGVAVALALGLQLAGLPNPLLWGVASGVLNFIPYLGPVLIVGLLTLAGVVAFPDGWMALLPPALFLAVHAVEANFIAPWFVGRRLVLSPVSVFLSVMLWGWLWGMAGALVAVPVLIGVRAVSRRTPRLRWLGVLLDGRRVSTPTLRALLARRPPYP
ncbi:MAG: AI-2E family transporter [Rubrivivax sp.]